MTTWRSLIFSSSLGLMAAAQPLAAAPIDLSNRLVLLQEDYASKSNTSSLALNFEVPKEFDPERRELALFLSGTPASEPPNIWLNGAPVEFWPVVRGDGYVVRLPWWVLKRGEDNLLEVKSADGSSLDLQGAHVFELLGSGEQSHFEHVFADPDLREAVLKAQPPKHPSQHKFDVQHYNLALTLNMSNTQVAGVLTMRARALESGMTQIALDFNENTGGGVARMVASAVDDGAGNPLTFTQDAANNWLLINIPSTVQDQEFTVRVTYAGTPSTSGVFGAPYRRVTHSGTPLIFTFSEPYGARQWWPCKDLPDDKFTIDLQVTCPDPYTVVTNGELVSIDDLGNGNRRFNYSEHFPIATYLVAVCATNYHVESAPYTTQDGEDTISVIHYTYPESDHDRGGLPGTLSIMNYLAQTFGEYPSVEDGKYANMAHASGSGMEHNTCTSMPNGDQGRDGGEYRRNIHEIAHHWFGNAITAQSFDHLWLNEGFATYAEALYYEHRDGFNAYKSYVAGWNSSVISDSQPMVGPDSDNFSGSAVYRKGGYVLHMLRHILGKEALLQAMRNHLQANYRGSAVTEDFEIAVEDVYGQEMDWFFDQWAYRTGRPTYSWTWQQSGTPGNRSLQVTITQTQSEAAFTMPLDVRVSDLNGNSQTFVVFNNQKSQTFTLSTGSLEAFNVSVDPDNWVLKGGSSAAAPQPTLLSAQQGANETEAEIRWASGGAGTLGYQVALSDDMTTWTLVGDVAELGAAATSLTLTGLTPHQPYYVRLRAVGTGGAASEFTDTYSFRLTPPGQPRVLAVDDYDRWSQQGRGPNHSLLTMHTDAIAEYGLGFDSVANEALTGSNPLGSYAAVVWMCGEDSFNAPDRTFNTAEQAYVENYLNGGGNLFVSGGEIGWDLDWRGSNADKTFYNTYLKTDYVSDDSENYSVVGEPGSIFAGYNFAFDDGNDGIYFQDFPDVVNAVEGGAIALRYGTNAGAGVQYAGPYTAGGSQAKLVSFGFAYETIYPQQSRTEVMKRVLDFFGLGGEAGVESFMLY